MENIENTENTPQAENLFAFDSEIINYLAETSKWGRFLAIVGYIGMGLLLLLGFFVMVGGSILGSVSEVDLPLGVLGFLYIVLAGLYYFPVNYLYKFSNRIKLGLNSNSQQSLTSGFENLKSLFKFTGIFTIVILSLYVLLIIIAVPMAIFLN